MANANGSKSWIRKAVAAIFGGKQCNGFVATTLEHAQAADVPAFLLKKSNAAEVAAKPDATLERMTELLTIAHRIGQRKEAQEQRDSDLAARHRLKVAKLLPKGVTVEDFNWGCRFNASSKALLVKAGLVAHNSKNAAEYSLPLNKTDGYNAACFAPGISPTGGMLPPSWDARFTCKDLGDGFNVWVEFDKVRDLNISERVSAALAEFEAADRDEERLYTLIANCQPRPLSLAVPEQIKASKKYPTGAEVSAYISRPRESILKGKT